MLLLNFEFRNSMKTVPGAHSLKSRQNKYRLLFYINTVNTSLFNKTGFSTSSIVRHKVIDTDNSIIRMQPTKLYDTWLRSKHTYLQLVALLQRIACCRPITNVVIFISFYFKNVCKCIQLVRRQSWSTINCTLGKVILKGHSYCFSKP